MAPSTRAASRTVRAMGPAVSWLWEIGTTRARDTRPSVGLSPTMPVSDAGQVIEPSVSVPIAALTMPAATATVTFAAEHAPGPAVALAEVLATSDVPGGVVNLLTGRAAEVAPWLASHMDVNAIDLTGVTDPELATELEVGQSFVDRCVLARNAGELTAEDASMAKLWCTELQGRAVDVGVQLHGGYGYMMEFPIAKAYLDSRISTIYGGTTEIQKEIIGRSLGL